MQLENRAGGSALHAPADRGDPLAALLAGTFRDPESGEPVAIETRSLVIAKSLAGSERDLIDQLGFGRRLAVVSDATTREVLGARVERTLAGKFDVASVVLPSGPHPDDATVAVVRKETARADALIAVGSGTLNDLCKFASAVDGKPYAIFATAPSMNGYVSLNAAITERGHKKSLPAQAPRGAFFDLEILSAAPARMIRAGVGDGLCRPTSQADWLLAHLLLDKPYRELPYALLEADEPALLDAVEALMAGDAAAMELLVRVLVLSGLGTAICGSSLPASQGEHLMSHYIDMFAPAGRAFVFHGEQVGVTTLSMARLQERMLDGPPPVLREDPTTEADFVSRYGEEVGRSCWKEFSQKRLDAEAADSLNHRLARDWDRIRARIAAIAAHGSSLERVLKRASAPTTPEEISCERGFYEEAIMRSREIRNRCTFLDLAADSGVLERLAPAL
jgi:glycerol-1-phosphate dehydrogenase [NAD(P)+]